MAVKETELEKRARLLKKKVRGKSLRMSGDRTESGLVIDDTPRIARPQLMPGHVHAFARALAEGVQESAGDGWRIEIHQDERYDGFKVVLRPVCFYGIAPASNETKPEQLRRAGRKIGLAAKKWRAGGCKEMA